MPHYHVRQVFALTLAIVLTTAAINSAQAPPTQRQIYEKTNVLGFEEPQFKGKAAQEHRIKLTKGVKYTFIMEGTFPTQFHILSPYKKWLGVSVDDGNNAKRGYIPETTGEYVIVASTRDENQGGTYTVRAFDYPGTEAPEKEPEKEPANLFRVKKNGIFTVRLSANPSTGYSLALKSMSPGIFLLSVETAIPKRQPGVPVPTGAPSTRVYTFFVPNKVDGQIVFARFRTFEFEKTYSEEEYRVQTVED